MAETLLIEIFTEELPPKALSRLGQAFADEVFKGLQSQDLIAAGTAPAFYATPRRLAVSIPGVLAKSADKETRVKVLPVNVALDADGNGTAALNKKLAALGFPQLTVAELERAQDGKAESFFYNYTASGIDLDKALQTVLTQAIAALPIPKVMRYQAENGDDVEFVRPAHGLVALYGADVIPVNALGLTAGRVTHGHRFQGAANISLAHADEYKAKLKTEGGVIASFTVRLSEIKRQLEECAAVLGADLRLSEREDLLTEVTALVENPTIYVGEFESEFLEVPQECLILTMQQNQKYFPLFDQNGKLLNQFLLVSNMRLNDPENIIEGNQRVIRPRLADARFFYQQDKKLRLADGVAKLSHVVYHNKLGSQLDRIGRLQRLSSAIAGKLGIDPAAADRAALLCKADLVTNMVGEFPELQGIMGRYYARNDGENADVADAMEAHYRPRFAGDELPPAGVATAVALADKMEALAGLFGIGQQPTGDKDPFGLRRAALGVIRILVEGGLPLALNDLIDAAFDCFPKTLGLGDAHTDLTRFIFDRMRGYFSDAGYTTNEIEAVLSQLPMQAHLIPKQLAAVRAFYALSEAPSLAAANKRIGNILKKAEHIPATFSASLFIDAEEKALGEAFVAAKTRADEHFALQDYTAMLQQLASLKDPVDRFFDGVMVMVDDTSVRDNRIGLLYQLRETMNRIADLSKLAV